MVMLADILQIIDKQELIMHIDTHILYSGGPKVYILRMIAYIIHWSNL